MPRLTNREKVVKYLKERSKTSTPLVTAKDVSKNCKLRSPQVASNYMREIFSGVDGIILVVDKSKSRRYTGTIYHILLIT
jgi:hypothetical protein